MATEEYLSTFRFSGDGVTLDWPVTFAGNHPDVASGTTPYISPADIEAIEVIPATDTSFEIQIPRELTVLGATSVRVSPAVASGRELIIRRRTEDRFNLVDFKTLQTVSEFDLDLANRQLLYLTQEATDRSRIAENTAESSITTAVNANITSAAALATAASAVVIADGALDEAGAAFSASATAVATANAATVTAEAATVTAGNAVDIAVAATDVADDARDVAEGIAGTAQNALDVANGIDGKATQALANSNTAITTANEADAIARQALDTAEAQGVLSFNGREAAVVPEAGDYSADQITFGGSDVATALGNKVDKVAGKQLSTEDFTTPEKDKLSTLSPQPLFSVMWWPKRSSIPAGYAPADGQLLSRATYPGAWAGIAAGDVPTVIDGFWLSINTSRGCYTDGDESTTFRLPDYNGVSAGSVGALFLRGGNNPNGEVQNDALRSHSHRIPVRTDSSAMLNPSAGNYRPQGVVEGGTADWAVQRTEVAGADETRPKNVGGVWIIKLFGAVVNEGEADAAQLATDVASLSGRVSTVEGEKPLGWGQTWQDVTSSRVSGVNYTNSTGRPIIVSPRVTGAPYQYHRISVGGLIVADSNSGGDGYGHIGTVPVVVPAGQVYSCTVFNGSILSWVELR